LHQSKQCVKQQAWLSPASKVVEVITASTARVIGLNIVALRVRDKDSSSVKSAGERNVNQRTRSHGNLEKDYVWAILS
jgi:hypothetical protein